MKNKKLRKEHLVESTLTVSEAMKLAIAAVEELEIKDPENSNEIFCKYVKLKVEELDKK